MINTILIVGGAGFLGNSLVKHLTDHNMNVAVADTKRRIEKYAIQLDGVEYVTTDLPDYSSIKKMANVNVAVHLAWSTNPNSSMQDVIGDAKTNLIGTLNLLESLQNHHLEKFIFMSSGGTVYGNCYEPLIPETCSTSPISAYGISKLACENYVNLYSIRKKFTPLNIRLGNPYGCYQLQGTPTGVVANFVRKIFHGDALEIYGDGETTRDYIHIDDVTECIERLISHPTIAGTYNLGSGVGVSVRNIIDIIEKCTNKEIRINYRESRRSDVRSVVLDVSKIRNDLGFSPQISIEDGIREMTDFYQLPEKFMSSI